MFNRIILSLIVFLVSGGSCYGNSPENGHEKNDALHLSYGPQIGMNLSNFVHFGIDCASRMNVGFYGGGFIQLDVIPQIAIKGNMAFNYKQSQFTLNKVDGLFRQWSVTIGVMAEYHINLPHAAKLNIGIGPYTDFGLSANYKQGTIKHNLYSRSTESTYPSMATSETGVGIELGYELSSGFQVIGAYRISISNITEANNTTVNIHPQTIEFGLAYRFGK